MQEHIEDIIIQQKERAKPVTGKAFLLSVSGIVIRLAIAQILCNLLISLTGVGLINILFYLYAIVLLMGYIRKTVAGYTYTLKESALYLQRQAGDVTTTLVEIPLGKIRAVRPVAKGERIALYYRQVTAIDPQAAPSGRVKAAFAASLFSAHLARLLAGKGVEEIIGTLVVYEEGGQLRACVFRPDEAFSAALEAALPQAYGVDDRKAKDGMQTLYARALARAFPACYPYVKPLIEQQTAGEKPREDAPRRRRKKQG